MRKYGMLSLAAIVLVFCSAFSENNFNYDFKSDYEASPGIVTFDHGAHATERQKDCHACHSALKIFGGSVNVLLAHNYCKDCHASMNGPTKCTGCHDKNKIAAK